MAKRTQAMVSDFLRNVGRVWAGTPDATQRGEPAPFAPWQARTLGTVKVQRRNGIGRNLVTRRYDRGSTGLAYQPPVIYSNPIGAGVVATRMLPVFAGPGPDYGPGGIFWAAQQINFGIQPGGQPVLTPLQLLLQIGPGAAPAALPATYPPSGG
jgi:hypothetical protein